MTESGNTMFFIAGTPSNSRGFEMSILEQPKLTSQEVRAWAGHVDSFISRSENDYKVVVKKVKFESTKYTLLTDYRAIEPSNKQINRGAYIAVGVIFNFRKSLAECLRAIELISEIHAYLFALRNGENAFDTSFSISEVTYRDMHKNRANFDIAESLYQQCNDIKAKTTNFDDTSKRSEIDTQTLDKKNSEYFKKIKQENKNLDEQNRELIAQNSDYALRVSDLQLQTNRATPSLNDYSSNTPDQKNKSGKRKKFSSSWFDIQKTPAKDNRLLFLVVVIFFIIFLVIVLLNVDLNINLDSKNQELLPTDTPNESVDENDEPKPEWVIKDAFSRKRANPYSTN